MTDWNSEDLRKALCKKIGHNVSDDQWKKVEPDWSDPYDEKDLSEILLSYRELLRREKGSADSNRDSLFVKVMVEAFYECELRVLRLRGVVDQTRKELFGTEGIPFLNLEQINAWIEDLLDKERQSAADPTGNRGHSTHDHIVLEGVERPPKGESVLLRWPKRGEAVKENHKDGRTFYLPEPGLYHARRVQLGGRLAQLSSHAKYLALYLGCDEAQAVVLILLDWVPVIPPIRCDILESYPVNHPRVRIEFDLSVPDRELLSTIQEVRREVRGFRKRRVNPSPQRAKKRAIIERYKGLSLEEIRRWWNKLNPDNRIEEADNLRRYRYK